jgi:nucleoside phosphorylase
MEDKKVLERFVNVVDLFFKGHKPLILLLSTCVSFTPEVCQEICHSTDWDVFQQFLQQCGIEERVELLDHALRQRRSLVGYQALARLIKAEYFVTIFTCSPDSLLEKHLFDLGCQPRVLVVGVHGLEYIARQLENPPRGICLIKLHGSLRERVLPPAFPQVNALPKELLEILQQYLNRDLIIAGSLAHDPDVARLLLANRQSGLYYVLPELTDPYDEVRRTIAARGYNLDTYILTGEQGAFDTFFPRLAERLSGRQGPATPESETKQIAGDPNGTESASGGDVLLVTVTEVEKQAVLALFPGFTLLHRSAQTYYNLGLVGGARVYLVQQPNMGSSDAGGSTLTIYKGIQDLAPTTVVMVGIAFGFNREKFALGDILVSEYIQPYEHQKVSSNEQNQPIFLSRGTRSAVSPRLLGLFKSNAQGWSGQPVAFGTILSGEKLIDNVGYRDQIRNFAPEALGGEMEGGGLVAASRDHAHRVDWILVKAISDWANGEKEVDKSLNQRKAAANAAQFVHYVLCQGGFKRPAVTFPLLAGS